MASELCADGFGDLGFGIGGAALTKNSMARTLDIVARVVGIRVPTAFTYIGKQHHLV